MIWKNIISYLEQGGKMNDDELQKWIKESKENQELLDLISIQWERGEITPPFSPDKVEAWSKISSKVNKDRSMILLTWSVRVAAALIAVVLGFAISMIISNLKPVTYTEVIAPRGHKSLVILPDGSRVTLNSETSIKYPTRFKGNKVNIELSGEAFFEITSDPSREFIVNTPLLSVNVHGTSFNMKSYDDENDVEVALEKGSISLFRGNNRLTVLKPGQAATLDRSNNKMYIQLKDLDIITAWKKDELVFDNTPFSEVARYLERYYGVDIELDPVLGSAHNFTFKLKVESLRETLKLINQISPIEFTINGKNVTIKASKK